MLIATWFLGTAVVADVATTWVGITHHELVEGNALLARSMELNGVPVTLALMALGTFATLAGAQWVTRRVKSPLVTSSVTLALTTLGAVRWVVALSNLALIV